MQHILKSGAYAQIPPVNRLSANCRKTRNALLLPRMMTTTSLKTTGHFKTVHQPKFPPQLLSTMLLLSKSCSTHHYWHRVAGFILTRVRPRSKYQQSVKQLAEKAKTKAIANDSEGDFLTAKVARKKAKLEAKLATHYKDLAIAAPHLTGFSMTPDAPHRDRILLPSVFTPTQRSTFQLEALAAAEEKLRIAQCWDTLEQLKISLGVRSFLTRHARSFNGTNATTRAQMSFKRAEQNVKQWATIYRRSFNALKKLGVSKTSLGNLRPLEEQDLQVLSTWLEEKKYASKEFELPWIWRTSQTAQVKLPNADADIEKRVELWNEEGALPVLYVHRIYKFRRLTYLPLLCSGSAGMGTRVCCRSAMAGGGPPFA